MRRRSHSAYVTTDICFIFSICNHSDSILEFKINYLTSYTFRRKDQNMPEDKYHTIDDLMAQGARPDGAVSHIVP